MGEDEKRIFAKLVEDLHDRCEVYGVPGQDELDDAARRHFIDCVLIHVLTCFPTSSPRLVADQVLEGTSGHGTVSYSVLHKKEFAVVITQVCLVKGCLFIGQERAANGRLDPKSCPIDSGNGKYLGCGRVIIHMYIEFTYVVT